MGSLIFAFELRRSESSPRRTRFLLKVCIRQKFQFAVTFLLQITWKMFKVCSISSYLTKIIYAFSGSRSKCTQSKSIKSDSGRYFQNSRLVFKKPTFFFFDCEFALSQLYRKQIIVLNLVCAVNSSVAKSILDFY